MGTAILSGSVTVAGLGVTLNVSRTDEGAIAQDPELPMAFEGDLTTRDVGGAGGIITTDVTHDILVTDFVWVFWELDGVKKVAYYGDVTGVTADTITFVTIVGTEGDGGEPLPLVNQSCQIAVGVEINTDFDGDDVSIIAASCTSIAHMRFMDVGPVELHEQDLVANEAWFWISEMGWTNPLTGNPVDAVWAAQAGVLGDGVFKLGVLYDSA